VKRDHSFRLSYQIGVAGFCFGNIMLFSFPEYFGLDSFTQHSFSPFFGYMNLVLSLPVFFFSAQDYFVTAYKGLRNRHISIDVPLALGILTMFVRSCYEVLSGNGLGWFDTHAGLVFFLLIGKWFQQKTFDTLSFDRDYKSYFPIAVTTIKNDEQFSVPVTSLAIGDRILIRNNEIIPADAILLNGEAFIDFSFVTGESDPVSKVLGEIVYAGGRQRGAAIELEVSKKVSQSYLTQLWNNDVFGKNRKSRMETFQQMVSRYFTITLLAIACTSGIWWLVVDPSLALNAFTAVLIIACPCALALSSPFALGTAMRLLGQHRFYLKSTGVLEQMAHIDTVVFDKTGTITQATSASVHFVGHTLDYVQRQYISSIVAESIHPLSQKIKQYLRLQSDYAVNLFEEMPGNGIRAVIDGHEVKMGAAGFVPGAVAAPNATIAAIVHVRIDEEYKGYFEIEQAYRAGLEGVLESLNKDYGQYLVSGDNDKEKKKLAVLFKNDKNLFFNQAPADKLRFIDALQEQGRSVMMVGDGLNDAGALKVADIGISVTENTSHFSPASDVIMDASAFDRLPEFLRFSKNTLRVIHCSFVISLLYNIGGLYFAVQGTLSPLFAAILMPVSSVTVILFTTVCTTLFFTQKKSV
jgi:Cu+-exporting ATPase